MKRLIRDTILAIGGLAAAMVMSGAWAAGLYKWVDDKGVVHYSDQAPPDVPAKGETVLDKQGRELKRIAPPPTPEELKAKAAAEERARALAKVRDDQARKDQALMQSYTNEGEIQIARQRAVGTIEAQIKSAEAYSADLEQRRQALTKQIANYGGKPVPAALENEAAGVDAELSRQAILLRQKQGELAMVSAKYDTIDQRWREIMADKERAAAADPVTAAAGAAKGGTGPTATTPAPTSANK